MPCLIAAASVSSLPEQERVQRAYLLALLDDRVVVVDGDTELPQRQRLCCCQRHPTTPTSGSPRRGEGGSPEMGVV